MVGPGLGWAEGLRPGDLLARPGRCGRPWRRLITVSYPLAVFLLGRRVALACAALVAALVVAGCGGGGSKPVSLPSISPSDSPTPTATIADPAAAAAAVVRRYLAVKSSLESNMDPQRLAVLETDDCSCRKFLESIRSTAADGNRYFGATKIRALTPTPDSLTKVEVLVLYDTTAGGTKTADGRVIYKGRPRKGVEALFTVTLVASHWLIADIANIKPGTT